jgi:hypothetical protein
MTTSSPAAPVLAPARGAARSVLAFGAYMVALGAALMLAPHLVLGALGLGAPHDVWPRAAGWALVALGAYYVQAARAGNAAFFRLTVLVRFAQFLVFLAFVIKGLAPAAVLLAAAVELAAGAWTWLELRRGAGRAAPA